MTYAIGAATNFGGGNDEIWDGGVLDTTRIIVNHLDATTFYPLVTVLEVSGATINAGTTVNPDGTNTGIKLTQGIATLTSSLAHICYTRDATPDISYVRRVTVSGTTATLANTLSLSFNTLYPMTICKLTATKSLLLYMKTDAKMYARVLTDDGTDISEGAEQGWFDQVLTTTQRINVERISDTLVCVAYAKAGTLWNITLSVSGDTVTLDKFVSPDSSSFYPSQVRARQIVILSSTKWVISYNRSSTDNRLVVVEDTGSLVAGTPIQISGSNDYISAIGARDSTHAIALVRDSLRMITFTESSRSLSNDGDDSTVPNSTSPSAGTPTAGYIGQVDIDDWILATWDSNTEAQGYQASIDISSAIVMDTLTLASSPQALTIFNRVTLNTLTLASSAEFLTHQPVALDTLTLVSSPQALDVIPIPLSTLTLASSAEVILIGQAFGLDTLTLASSAESLTVSPGAIQVIMNTLTLASSAETLGVGAPGVIVLDTLTLASSTETLGRVQTFIFTPTQINNLRLTAHETTCRMTIFAPPTLWTGVVNGVHDRGATNIVYDGGAGSLTFVRDFLQLTIGTSPGGDDIGRLRVDDIGAMTLTTGTIVVDENAIPWEDGYYLSIEHLFPIERINPRIAGGVLYKFFDVAYTDENGQDDTDPVCLADSDQIAELVAGAHVFNIDLSDSHPTTGGVISSYTLSVAPTLGAVVSFNTGTGIGTVTVDRAGYWWAICSCTDSFGNSMERFVLLRTHDSTDTEFITVDIVGYSDVWGGGVRVQVEARTDVLLSDIPDNAIAYLWHDNKFDGVSGYVNIFGHDDNLLFNGYVRSDRSRDNLDTGDGSVTFTLTTVDGLMENLPLRSIPLRLKSSPTDWWQYQLLTTSEAIWFLFRWHSTIPWRHDIIGIKDFDAQQRRLAADFEEGTIFRMANQVGFERGVVAKVACDRLGRIHFVQDSQLLNQADRDAIISAWDIQEGDVSGVIDTVREPEQKTHTMQISGFVYDNNGDGTPYIAIIPGYQTSGVSFSMPERRGSSFRNIPNQLLRTQLEANERVGRFFAQANRPIKEFRIPFRGNYLGALTTIPSFGWYEMNIQNTTLARQLSVNSLRLLCRSIQANYDTAAGVLRVTGIFEPEAQGPDGILGNYPTSLATVETTTSVIPVPEEFEFAAEAMLVAQSGEYRRIYPPELEDSDWIQFDASSFNHAAIDPWWQIINETDDPDNLIWVAAGSGTITLFDEDADTETDITPTNDPPNTWSDGVVPTVAALEFVEVLADRWIQDRFYVLAEWQEVGDDWRTWVAVTSNRGTSWTWLDFFDGYGLAAQGKARNLAVNNTYLMTVLNEALTGDTLGDEYLRVYTKSNLIGFSRVKANSQAGILEWDTVESCTTITVTDDDDVWFLFGNMIGGDTLGSPGNSNKAHIIFTIDAGVTWTSYENRWTGGGEDSKCITLRVGPADTAGIRPVWAVRS